MDAATVVNPAHSLLGASSMKRWATCAPSFKLSQSVPAPRTSVYAAAGTLAHQLIETAVLSPKFDPESLRDTTYDIDGHVIPVDDDLLDGVKVWVEWARGIVKLADWHVVEARVKLDTYFRGRQKPPAPLFGTTDLLAYNGRNKLLIVGDYKHGSGVEVEVRDNHQLLYYAAGGLVLAPGAVDHVVLVVVQPNIRGRDKVRLWKVATIDVLTWVDDVLIPAVMRTQDPQAPLVTGEHCRFCPARSACPALRAAAQKAGEHDFHALGRDIGALDNLALGVELDNAVNAERWIDALREEAKRRIEVEGVTVPGWEIVPTRPVRSWDTSTETVVQQFLNLHNVRDYMTVPELRSPAQIEKLLDRQRRPNVWAGISGEVVSRSGGTKLSQKPVLVFNDPSEDMFEPVSSIDEAIHI